MESEGSFERRVCAVLLADVTGFSKLMGEDDERTAAAVHRYQSIAQGIVSDAKGHAEPVAGDALFATFDSVVSAVDAALAIQRRLHSEDFGGMPLTVRIGVHLGDVLLRDGRAFGDAINIAARLESLARPGTVCISEPVYRQVRNRFDDTFVDLGVQRLKNISDPLRAYLIVPREMGVAAPPAGRRRLFVGLAGAAVLGVGAAAAVWLVSVRTPPAPGKVEKAAKPETTIARQLAEQVPAPEAKAEQVTLGVMVFRAPAGSEQDWRREALRDGLNAQLSKLSRVKVYSKEFLDFLVSRKGLSEIEAATQLGIKKMLSGSLVEKDGVLQIETHVVDVTSGVLEVSYTTSGNAKDFVNLQNQTVLEIIARLDLPATEAERQELAKSNVNAEALKLLLEAEGGGAPSSQTPAPQSSLPRASSLGDLFAPASAWADESEAAIRQVLEAYRKAMESGQVDGLSALFRDFTPEQKAAQERYFGGVRDLKVTIDDVDIAVVGDEAVVSYTRTDDFADAKTGRPMHVSVRLTKTLQKDGQTWKLAGGK